MLWRDDGRVFLTERLLGTNKAGAKKALVDIAEIAGAGCGFEVSAHPAEGDRELAIVAYAKEVPIDLFVVGTRGRTGLNHIFLGSMAERTIRLAPCPVMVVKDKEADEECESHYPKELTRRPWVAD